MPFVEDFRKPVNIIFLLLAIAGIVLSVYFYFNGRKTKSISYQINEPSSLIYDSHNSTSAIKVSEKDSIPIKDNVYLLTGIIWNSGNIPVTTEDVRKKIFLNLSSVKKILDFKIVKQIDADVAEFRLAKRDNKSIDLSWRYFDPGYGFRFQIIYTGYENSQFTLNGKILDITQFTQEKQPKQRNYPLMLFGTVTLFFMVVLFNILNIKRKRRYNLRMYIIYIFVPIIYFIVLLYLIFYTNNPLPYNLSG